MNGKKAKLCRKIAFGDKNAGGKHFKKGRKYGQKKNGQIVADLDRHKYQLIKKVSRGMDAEALLMLDEKLHEQTVTAE